MAKLLLSSLVVRFFVALALSLFIQTAGLGLMYMGPGGLSLNALYTIVSMHIVYVNYWVLIFQTIINMVLLRPS